MSGGESTPPGKLEVPKELYDALSDCVVAFQECSGELRKTRESFEIHTKQTGARLDDMNRRLGSIENRVAACDAGVGGLRAELEADYGSLRDMAIEQGIKLDGARELAASAYDIGESLTHKLKAAGVINGDQTRRRSGSAPG